MEETILIVLGFAGLVLIAVTALQAAPWKTKDQPSTLTDMVRGLAERHSGPPSP